ncbi:MAG: hypothetical protein Q8S73_20470 [Deltaproteobacteria bacterium]|nr:hypothetical protein [Myxococcales bacterium]MDP3216495.1 hypothetical protein [Deltaproteobacteria bacterium]
MHHPHRFVFASLPLTLACGCAAVSEDTVASDDVPPVVLPSSDAGGPTPFELIDAAVEPADAPIIVGDPQEYVAGECRVRFDTSRFASSGDTLTVRGSVLCTAERTDDPLALGVLDPLSISSIQCSAPRTAYLGSGRGESFTVTLRSVGTGTHAAEFIVSNAVRTGTSLVPGDALRRFTVMYATGLPDGVSAPVGLGVRQGVTFDDVVAVGRSVLRGVSNDLAPFVSVCVGLAPAPKLSAACALVTLEAAATLTLQRTLGTLIDRSSLSPTRRLLARLAVDGAILGRGGIGVVQSTRTLATLSLDASQRAAVLSSDHGRSALSTALSAASDLADLLVAGSASSDDVVRTEPFTTTDGRSATLLHLSVGAPMCSASRESHREASFVLVSHCGDRRCEGETAVNCPADCAPTRAPSLRVTAPAGEAWAQGRTYAARWEGRDLDTPVRLVIRRDGVEIATATTLGAMSGAQDILVPATWVAASGYEVCATAHNGAIWSCSPRFEVRGAPSIRVTAPAGEPWTIGQRYVARWEGRNLTSPVRVVIRRDGVEQVTVTTTGAMSGEQGIDTLAAWAPGAGWEVCATAESMGSVWSCSPRFSLLPRPTVVVDAGAPIDAGVVAPDVQVVAPDVQVVADRPAPAPDVQVVDAGSPSVDLGPSASPARLEIELTNAANAECAEGGWTIVLFDASGRPVRALAPGAALQWDVPATVTSGMLAFGVQCGAGRWRDWSSWLGRSASVAGVARVRRGGVDLTDRVMVCDPPWLDRSWLPAWRIQPLIGMSAGELGTCP